MAEVGSVQAKLGADGAPHRAGVIAERKLPPRISAKSTLSDQAVFCRTAVWHTRWESSRARRAAPTATARSLLAPASRGPRYSMRAATPGRPESSLLAQFSRKLCTFVRRYGFFKAR
jgi:hypothetical protein